MTEVEKSLHIVKKYRNSKKVYTVYKREQTTHGLTFTLIYGSDDKQKVKKYTDEKEQEGLSLIVYCARPQEQSSSCCYKTVEP